MQPTDLIGVGISLESLAFIAEIVKHPDAQEKVLPAVTGLKEQT